MTLDHPPRVVKESTCTELGFARANIWSPFEQNVVQSLLPFLGLGLGDIRCRRDFGTIVLLIRSCCIELNACGLR